MWDVSNVFDLAAAAEEKCLKGYRVDLMDCIVWKKKTNLKQKWGYTWWDISYFLDLSAGWGEKCLRCRVDLMVYTV